MRRIVTAVRSLTDRAPSLLRFIPDVLLLVGYVGLGWTIAQVNTHVAMAWLFGWPFAIGLLVEADTYRRRRRP